MSAKERRGHDIGGSLRGLLIAMGVLSGVTSCAEPVFHCSEDDACTDARGKGTCVVPGYCAFESEHCATGLEYGALAPAELSGECVPDTGDPGGSTSAASTGSATSSGDDAGPNGSSGGPESTTAGHDTGLPCPAGTPCDPHDACAVEGTCDAAGECAATAWVVCDRPPSACHEPVGTCGSTGGCEYAPLAAGEVCDDGDACTEGDACDGEGACTPGALCPEDDPCATRACVEDACVVTPVEDGTSCGAEAAARCCGGACVDISSDTAHCGGCNTACAAGLQCESISATNTCEIAPEATSGRCRCQFSNAQCPGGQICRTFTPYTDRCVPPSEANCDGAAFYQNSCPSFCGY
jgi:hypothetical protein